MSKNVSILSFKGIYQYCDYWDKVVKRAIEDEDNSEYGRLMKEWRGKANSSLLKEPKSEDDAIDKVKTFGYPLPLDYEDAMARRSFQNMELYNNVYNQLTPFLGRLQKISEGILPKDAIKPNDRQLGVFSLERAMMSIEATPSLYSKKSDKYYPINDGTMVLDKKGNNVFDKEGNQKFKLKNGEEAVLVQKITDGVKEWGSSNKKSFLYKEKVPRPNKVVRLFVLVGAHWGFETFWAGVTAVICANFLQTKGYAVRITAVMGIKNQSGMNFGGNDNTSGTRYSLMDVKSYDEPIDSLSLLYVLADASFFRVRQFQYYYASQYKYRDEANSGIGGLPMPYEFEQDLSDQIKKRVIAEEKDTLYYYFGGEGDSSIESAKKTLARIICKAETINKETLKKLGYEFPETDENGKQYDDFDCNDY